MKGEAAKSSSDSDYIGGRGENRFREDRYTARLGSANDG
ncbi:hypothetical protein L195_g063127, partial [Trifolium pratense]